MLDLLASTAWLPSVSHFLPLCLSFLSFSLCLLIHAGLRRVSLSPTDSRNNDCNPTSPAVRQSISSRRMVIVLLFSDWETCASLLQHSSNTTFWLCTTVFPDPIQLTLLCASFRMIDSHRARDRKTESIHYDEEERHDYVIHTQTLSFSLSLHPSTCTVVFFGAIQS